MVEATATRYDGGDVLRISGRLKLVCDTVMTSQATALAATVTGAFAVWLGHEK
ncbi:hypothetical protein OAQ47_05075 [Paracoccaceae bacterium]|nr:hypothetical protein [Paracoccaceae bacterium]